MSFISYPVLLIPAEISLSVPVRNTADDSFQRPVIRRVLSVLYPTADELAHNSSKILMSGIGQKAP